MNVKIFQVVYYFFRLWWPKCQVGVAYPLAQAVHESANFTSSLAKRANNFLGMKWPTVRSTTATGIDNGYAAYGSPIDCIRDYFRFLDHWKIYTTEQLVIFLQTKYAEDGRYFGKVEAVRRLMVPQLIDPKTLAVAAGGFSLASIYGIARGADYLAEA